MLAKLNRTTNNIEQAVLLSLTYFDIFKYPLRIDEIHNFCPIKMELEAIESHLAEMIEKGIIFMDQGYYSLSASKKNIAYRIKTNNLADAAMPDAIHMAERIGRFPFVRAVSISGSLSKQVMHDDSDIDYFIITEKNRLWIAKLFLVIYKRVLLLNNKERFCINYFISLEDLTIDERNVFTATELATLLPITGKYWVEKLWQKNNWIVKYLPQLYNPKSEESMPVLYSNWVEKILKGRIGNLLDRGINKLVIARNKMRYLKHKGVHFELMFRSTAQQSKVHTSNHQTRILDLYHARLHEINNELNIALTS